MGCEEEKKDWLGLRSHAKFIGFFPRCRLRHLILCQAPLDTRMLIRVGCGLDLSTGKAAGLDSRLTGAEHRAGLREWEKAQRTQLLRDKE